MARTLLLDGTAWDLVLDAGGNIALAEEPYALAQDAASAVRTFSEEAYYDTSLGVPYFDSILGQYPPAQVMKAAFVREALRVPDVVTARAFLLAVQGRQLAGQVQVTGPVSAAVAVSPTAPLAPPVPASDFAGAFDFDDPRQSALETV